MAENVQDNSVQQNGDEDFFKKMDALISVREYELAYRELTSSDEWRFNPRMLWRLAQLKFMQSKQLMDSEFEEVRTRGEDLLNEAKQNIRHAAEIDDSIEFVCKWAAILFWSDQSFNQFKYYVSRALEVEPDMDADSLHLLGVSNLNQAASYENIKEIKRSFQLEAIKIFEKADNAEKHPSVRHKLMIMRIGKDLYEFHSNSPTGALLLKASREIISQFKSSSDPNDKKVLEEALLNLRKPYSNTEFN